MSDAYLVERSLLVPADCARMVARGLQLVHQQLVRDGMATPAELTALLAAAEHLAKDAPLLEPPASREQWISAAEAARRKGCSVEYLTRLARAGRVRARRSGKAWEIADDAVPRASSVRNRNRTGTEPRIA